MSLLKISVLFISTNSLKVGRSQTVRDHQINHECYWGTSSQKRDNVYSFNSPSLELRFLRPRTTPTELLHKKGYVY